MVKHQPILDCLAMYRYSYVKAIVLKWNKFICSYTGVYPING